MLKHLRDLYRRQPTRVWVVFAAFVVSFGYALIYRIVPSVDARKFHEIAVHLVTQHSFCFDCNVPLAQDSAIRDIGPGYQFFLAGLYSLFGIRLWVVWLVQALLFSVVVWWMWGLAERVIPAEKRATWMIALPMSLLAVHPDIVQGNAMLMADGLFTFLLVASIVVCLPYLERVIPHGWKRPLLLGVLLGLLAMVKPTGVPLFIGIMMLLLCRRIWKAALIVTLCFIAVQTPWAVRNLMTYDHFIYNSVVGGLDMWVGLYPQGTGEFNLDALPEIAHKIEGLSPDQVDHVSMEQVKTIIREHPLFAIQRTASKFFKLFALSKTSGFWFHYRGTFDQGATVLLSALFNLLLLGMGFAAVAYMVLKRLFKSPLLWVMCIVILLLSASPTLTVVVNRYRIPMLPFFAVLSAFWLAEARGRDRWLSLGTSVAFLVLCTGIDLAASWDKLKEHLSRFV